MISRKKYKRKIEEIVSYMLHPEAAKDKDIVNHYVDIIVNLTSFYGNLNEKQLKSLERKNYIDFLNFIADEELIRQDKIIVNYEVVDRYLDEQDYTKEL